MEYFSLQKIIINRFFQYGYSFFQSRLMNEEQMLLLFCCFLLELLLWETDTVASETASARLSWKWYKSEGNLVNACEFKQ